MSFISSKDLLTVNARQVGRFSYGGGGNLAHFLCWLYNCPDTQLVASIGYDLMRRGSYINFPEVSRLVFSLGDSRPPNDRKKDVT